MRQFAFNVLFHFSNLELELDKFGFDGEEKMNVYTALAIVLHLGNITFQVGSLSGPLSVSLSHCLSYILYL